MMQIKKLVSTRFLAEPVIATIVVAGLMRGLSVVILENRTPPCAS
jgi:hypothetical protein